MCQNVSIKHWLIDKELSTTNTEEKVYGNFSVCLNVIQQINKNLNQNLNQKYNLLYNWEKQQLLHDLAKAYPWLEIFSSLEIWDKIHQSIFTWIKPINDTYSQLFTDKLINKTAITIKIFLFNVFIV